MTEVAYGNLEAMSAPQDISTHQRLEGLVSPGLPSSSNPSLDGAVFNPGEKSIDPNNDEKSIDPNNEEDGGGTSGKLIPASNIESEDAAAGHGKVTLMSEKCEVTVGTDNYKACLGSPQRYLLGTVDSSIEEPVLEISKAELGEDLPAVEISAGKMPALEVTAVETSAGDLSPVKTPAVILSPLKTHAVGLTIVETRALEFPVTTDTNEETTLAGERSHFQDLVEDVDSGVISMDGPPVNAITKEKSADRALGGEQESHSRLFQNEGQDVATGPTVAKELPQTEIEVASQHSLARNHIVSPSQPDVIRIENEVNSTENHVTGGTAEEITQKLTEDLGDKLIEETTDKMENIMADGMADRLADALADEIADQIADRMADEIADKMVDEMADGIADDMADRMADEMANRMVADEMANRMADEMADRMADEMADRMAAEVADELADEVVERHYVRGETTQENERMDDGETHEVGGLGDVEMTEYVNKVMDVDEYEDDEGSPTEQRSFVEELERFFKQRNLEYKAPKFYGLELNVLKLWKVVSRYGGYDHVTLSKLWRTVGEEFKPPKTCTTISWSFRGFYEKALLDYERFKSGVSAPNSMQRAVQTMDCHLTNSQQTASPATPSSGPNAGGTPGSGSGRARRDAAARAMQGWHSQRMGNGDAKESNSQDKRSAGKHVKKEKKLSNRGGNGLKRKGSNTVLERAVKAVQARGRPRLLDGSPPSNSAVTGKRSMKPQDSGRRPMKLAKVDEPEGGFDPPIVDEGPKADWVKINVHKHLDCFEIYALVPGLAREEVRIQCEPGGRLVIAGMPEDPENPWGVTPFRKVICLPSRIDAHQTSAVVTLYGQLYVRIPIADDKSS